MPIRGPAAQHASFSHCGCARSYRFWGPAARSYRFWGPLGTIWDLWGPSGDHHSKKLSILIIFSQNMSFLAKNALSKFIMSFFTRISNETAHQSKKLEKNNMGINMAINMSYINILGRMDIYMYISHINSHINSLLIP